MQKLYGLPEIALIDMGDFVGGMLKYLRTHPVPRVTIAGGVAKMTKLAQGLLDLHSKRGTVDLAALADAGRERPAARASSATASSPPTPPRRPSLTPARTGSRSAMQVATPAWATAARVSLRAPSRSRSWCSTARDGWSAARRSPAHAAPPLKRRR